MNVRKIAGDKVVRREVCAGCRVVVSGRENRSAIRNRRAGVVVAARKSGKPDVLPQKPPALIAPAEKTPPFDVKRAKPERKRAPSVVPQQTYRMPQPPQLPAPHKKRTVVVPFKLLRNPVRRSKSVDDTERQHLTPLKRRRQTPQTETR